MKHFRWVFTFLKQLKHQILGFTVSKATLNCKQKIFGDQFYRRYILGLFKNLCRLRVLRICFSQFFQDTFYTWNAHLGTRVVELIKPSCQAKAGAQKLFFI